MATISIHAPRTGSDLRICCIPIATCHFNPRSPHGERPMRWNSSCIIARFQSTLPARGATPANARNPGAQGFQSTLPARGATCRGGFHLPLLHISIHAPRTGSDKRSVFVPCAVANFNPRSPHGERRSRDGAPVLTKGISIHAPRTGSDKNIAILNKNSYDFNPRSPHGERLVVPSADRSPLRTFQSTLPARGAT